MVNKMIKKQFNKTLNKKDFFLYLINRNTFILTTPLILAALITAFIFVVTKDGYQNTDLVYALPILLFLLIYVQMYRSITKAINNNNVEIEIDESKYTELSNGETVTMELDKFYSFYENKFYFYLFVDKVNAIILPKREFSDEENKKINFYFSTKLKRNSLINFKNILNIIFSVLLIACMVVLIIAMFK